MSLTQHKSHPDLEIGQQITEDIQNEKWVA